MTPEIVAAAEAWLAEDPDPETRAELRDLLERAGKGDRDAATDLAARFGSRLTFGTAGLRARLGAGSARMNRVVVAQTAAGIAAFLLGRAAEGDAPRVVIGYDGRRNSQRFAIDTAEILAGAGLRPILLPRLLPTPVLAFAVRHLDPDAGIMVTASHNPRDDNGYKVYLGGDDAGSQIAAPVDAEIAAHIDRIAVTRAASALPRSVGYAVAGEDVVTAYVAATSLLAPSDPRGDDLRWVYTALHGVGWETLAATITTAGSPKPILVAAQIEPDATFPTAAFPNPEESGALDLAFAVAREHDADLVLANDPDADRLAVAVPDDAVDGGWRRLTGNDVGLLLGWEAARHAREAGIRDAALASTLVSSPALELVAEHYGLRYHSTPTGFKWISRVPDLVYGYEEALGYLVNPHTVRDKDGISAALAVLDIAVRAKTRGETIADLLAEFRGLFGHFESDQVSVRVDDIDVITRTMASLRRVPPTRVGETKVKRFDDLLTGVDGLPASDVLRIALKGGSRILIRPSGTEPKLKVYIDVRGDGAADARAKLAAVTDAARSLIDERS